MEWITELLTKILNGNQNSIECLIYLFPGFFGTFIYRVFYGKYFKLNDLTYGFMLSVFAVACMTQIDNSATLETIVIGEFIIVFLTYIILIYIRNKIRKPNVKYFLSAMNNHYKYVPIYKNNICFTMNDGNKYFSDLSKCYYDNKSGKVVIQNDKDAYCSQLINMSHINKIEIQESSYIWEKFFHLCIKLNK